MFVIMHGRFLKHKKVSMQMHSSLPYSNFISILLKTHKQYNIISFVTPRLENTTSIASMLYSGLIYSHFK